MARLTGDAARQWLAQNPGASFIDNRTGQRVERQKSGIENLILGLSKPFRSGVGVAQEFGHTMGDLMNMAGGNYGAIGERPEKYALMSEEESRQLYEDPLKQGLKAGAGVMSYGLGGPPAGGYQAASALGRIGQAAGRGALASGIGGFGYSEEGKELESTLKGGLTGGIIGGALQGVGEGVKALGKIKRAPTPKVSDAEMSNWVDLKDVKKIDGLSASDDIKKGIGVLKREGNRLGLDMSNRFSREQAAQGVVSSLSDDVDNLITYFPEKNLVGKGGVVSKTDLAEDILSNIKNVPKYDKTDGYIQVANILGKYGDDLTGKEVRSIYQEIAKAGNLYDTASKAKSIELLRRARNAVRGKVTGPAGQLLDDISAVYDVTPFLQGKVGKSVGPYVAGMSLRPVGLTKATDAVTSTVRGYGPVLGGAGEKAGNVIGGAANLGQRAIPALQGLGQGRDVEQGDVTMGGSLSPEEAQILQQGSAQPQYTYQDAIMEAYQMFPGAPESTILSAAKFFLDQKGGGEDLDMGTINNVEKAIGMIDQYGGRVAGKIAKGTGKVGEFFGAGGVGTEYRSLISDIRTNLIRYIAGTAQTPTEMKNLVDRLPQPTDEPAVAKIKLQVLLDSLYGESQSAPSGTPNVSGSIADDYNLDWAE